MNLPFDPETTTCIFCHPKLKGVYYCSDSPDGMTGDVRAASKFMGEKSRTRGMNDLKERFPKIKDGYVMFFYLNER
jgi:hypothetical protein